MHQGWDWWGPTCFHDFTKQLPLHKTYYFNNTCVIGNSSSSVAVGYAKWSGCDDGGIMFNETEMETWTSMHDNRVYVDGEGIGLCNMTETEFHSKTGLDAGTIVYSHLLNDEDLLAQAKELLWNSNFDHSIKRPLAL